MQVRLSAVIVVVIAVFFTLPAVAAEKPTIAVMPLRVQALQMNEVKRINDAMREAAKQRGYELQSEEDTTQLLEASQSLGLDCDVNAVDCGVRLGQIADVQYIVLGQAVGALDGRIGMDATLVDVKTKALVRRASTLLPQDPLVQADAIQREFSDVLYPRPDGTGPLLVSLALEVSPVGADIFVDGIARGTSPLSSAVDTLAPGEHYVVVEKKGFLPFRSRLAVNKGEAARLQVTLAVDPDAMRTAPTGLEAAAPWIVTGVGGVALIAGGVATIFGVGDYNDYVAGRDAHTAALAKADQSALTAKDIEDITDARDAAAAGAQRWNTTGQTMVVAGSVGAGVGLLTVIGGVAWGIYQQMGTAPAEGAE